MNRTPILFLNVLVVATCGLVYELVAGALAQRLSVRTKRRSGSLADIASEDGSLRADRIRMRLATAMWRSRR